MWEKRKELKILEEGAESEADEERIPHWRGRGFRHNILLMVL